MRYNKTNQNTLGFTLIEILLTSALVAVVGTGIFIALDRYQFYRNLDLDARSVSIYLSDAQERSLTQEIDSTGNSPLWGVRLTNTSDSTNYFELITRPNTSGSPTITPVKRVLLRRGVQFLNPTVDQSSYVLFEPLTGIPTNDSALQVTLGLTSNSNATRTITIDLQNGKIKLE